MINQELKNRTKIFACNSNYELFNRIAEYLGTYLAPRVLDKFSDGEIQCEIMCHVRDTYAFVLQSTSSPVNNNLMELLILADALKRQGVDKIVAVVPYYGYARQDRKPGFSRTPITSRLVADMMKTAGISRIITVDIHSEQQLGFFADSCINISASPELVGDIWIHHFQTDESVVIVSPDAGGVERAREVAKHLDNADLAIVDKRRPKANQAEIMNIIGEVKGRRCIVIDDMIDTAGTLCKSATALKKNGATYVAAYATHAVFSGKAYENIVDSVIDEIVITDTIPLKPEMANLQKIRQISVAKLLAETIYRVRNRKSISEMYV